LGISPLRSLVVRFHSCVYREVSIEYLTPWLDPTHPLPCNKQMADLLRRNRSYSCNSLTAANVLKHRFCTMYTCIWKRESMARPLPVSESAYKNINAYKSLHMPSG